MPASRHDDAPGDHVHSVAYTSDHSIEPVTNPDNFYDQIDRRLAGQEAEPEDSVTFAQMASAFTIILDFICKNPHPSSVAGRALALQFWLHPESSPYDSVAQIAVNDEASVIAGCEALTRLAHRSFCFDNVSNN